ncbi:hypothetical protein [Lewinella sp. LCG006]|uniref:hypothetical protein n=1 Tax=Lewinella sp. LCG006 TaxID=3231911 RepID=UPI00345F408D
MRTLLLFPVLCLMFFTCNNKDPLAIDTGECNEVYVMDVALPSILQPLVWLNDSENNVVFEDGNIATGGITYFLNAVMACEERYSLSLAGKERVNLDGGGLVNRILIQQVAEVEQRSGIRFASISDLFYSSGISLTPINVARFNNSPEIDSVIYMGLPAGQMTTSTRFSYIYDVEQEQLRVTFRPFAAENTNGLLAVRLAATGEWLGREINFRAFNSGSFNGFEPLEYKSFALNLPAGVSEYQIRVAWLKDNTSPSFVILGDYEHLSTISLLVPRRGNGFLVRTIIPGETTYLNQQYFEQWPTEVNVAPRYFLEEASLNYPFVSIAANDGDVVFLNNDYPLTSAGGIAHWKRQYVGPMASGLTSLQLASEGDLLRSKFSLAFEGNYYYDTFGSALDVSIYDYPLQVDGYQGIIRDAFRISNNQQSWLRTQVYEAVKQRITD